MLSNCGVEKTLESPLDSKAIKWSNQSIIKETNPEYSLEGLKLKLQYFGHLMWRTDYWKRSWCWERLEAGGEGDDRGWDGWMASPTLWTWVWVSSGSWWWTGKPGMLQSMGSQKVGHDWVTELNWTFLVRERSEKPLTKAWNCIISTKARVHLSSGRNMIYKTEWRA